MSKNKHGDLFNTSLTEIIIILFFVLMLFALYNIDKVNKENVDLGNEVDEIANNLETEKAKGERLINALNDNGPAIGLGPYNVALILEIEDLEKKNQELQKEIERLAPQEEPIDIVEEPPIIQPVDSQRAGNCIDKTFWRNCAEWAWPSVIVKDPPVEFLFDIGMCGAGDIVVIKSAWKEKQEIDFDMVDGANAITNKMYIKRNEIIEFMSLIHDESLDFKEGQTQHAARLINLESIDTDLSKFPRNAIADEMMFVPTTRFEENYQEIKSRFPINACSFFKSDVQANNNSIPKIILKPIPKIIQQESKIPSTSSIASFKWDGKINCDRASGRTSSKFIIKLNLEITSNKRVKVKNYDYEKTNRNNRLVAMDIKKSITRQKKNIVPATNNGKPINSLVLKNYEIEANVCSKF